MKARVAAFWTVLFLQFSVIVSYCGADIITGIDSKTKYRIESLFLEGSSAALGVNHGVNSPLCVTTQDPDAADCLWYFIEQGTGTGKYALKNASTSQYITLDDQYTNSPEILRYVHLSSSIEAEASLWYICNTTADDGSELFYFQSVANGSYFFNVRNGTYALGAYSKSGIPYGLNETFNLYDEKGKQFHTSSDPDPIDPDTTGSQLEPVTGKILFVYRADGRVEAFPRAYIDKVQCLMPNGEWSTLNGPWSMFEGQLSITTKDSGPTYTFKDYEVDSLSEVSPPLPEFNSFKFNNKFNHHIIEDAIGVFEEDTLITLQVVGIGKTLRPSFKLDEDVQAWIGDSLQHSKVTRVRFDKDVVYTVARCGQTILRRRFNGEYLVRPYGQDYTVRVDFATDHSNSSYKVPSVYVTTNDGTSITSKHYYWDGKIRIDGAGVFPDLPETDMQIKGRGNSSWTSSGKAPYHFKFETATKVLGLKKGKHWNLIANAQSHSMTSNAVAMKMAQLVETAGFNHEIPVELYVNGEYRGSYNLTEKIGLSNNSVDLDDETNAVLLELDSYYDETYKFRDQSYNLPVNIKEPDFSEGTTSLTQSMIQESFNRSTEALKNKDEYLEYYYDLDYLARFLFVTDYTANVELMHPKSTFVYNANIKDSSSPYVFGPVWDFDWAYGFSSNRDYFTTHATLDFWSRTGSEVGFAWSKDMRYNITALDKKYYNLWYDFINDGSLDELVDFCDDYYQFAAPSFSHDNSRWGRGNAQTYASITRSAKTWLKDRANFIFNYMSNTLGYASKGYLEPNGGRPLIGDVNGDGSVTTSDVVCVLNYMLNLPNEDFEFYQADTDKNGIITVADVINVRNLITTTTPPIVFSGRYYGLPEADAAISSGCVTYTDEGVAIPLVIAVDDGDYSGLQFDLRIPDGMTLDNLDLSRSLPDFDVSITELDNAQCYRVSIYASSKHKLPRGKSELTLELGKNNSQFSILNSQLLSTSLSNVLFSTALGEDERSRSRTVEFCLEEPTGINSAVSIVGQQGNSVTLSSSEAAVVPVYGADGRVYRLYSLKGGRETITLPPGVYIINKEKVIIR